MKRINENLKELKDDYEELFEFAPIGYFIVDNNFIIKKLNNNSKKWFEAEIDKNIKEYIEPNSQSDFYFFAKDLIIKKEARVNVVFRSCGEILHFELIGKKVNSKPNHYLIACIDVERQFMDMEKIKNLSFRDQLTGLYNRRYFEEELKRLTQPRQMPFSIIIGDVNGLKLINDAFGHKLGDDLLINASSVMGKIDRGTDVISRIGGDEIAVLLPKTNEEELKKILSRFDKSCSDLKLGDISYSIAFGAATMNDVSESVEDVIKIAEDRMYRNKLLNESSKNATIINSILKSFYLKYPNEELHSKRVSNYMEKMGEILNLDKNRIEVMKLAGLLHDIGKISIDYSVLDKNTSHTKEDIIEIKKHPEIGYRILNSSTAFSEVAPIVLYHHEWVNGKGYPRGIKGDDIPYESRVLSICDAYDAMVCDRPYREAMSKEDAIAELEFKSGTQFDKEIVEIFVKMIRDNQN